MNKTKENIRKSIILRIKFVFFMIAVLGFCIVGRINYIQYYEGKKYQNMALQQHVKQHEIKAIRGNIYSENGKLMCTSVPRYDLRMDFKTDGLTVKIFNQNKEKFAEQLADIFTINSRLILEKLNKGWGEEARYFALFSNITPEQKKAIEKTDFYKLGKFTSGIIIPVNKTKRKKPFKELAKRTLGFVNKQDKTVGLEGWFNDTLKGINGLQFKQKISGSDWKPIHEDNDIEPKNGKDLITTIDIDIQDIAQNALEKALLKHQAKMGCVVVMEVETGEIKAIANLTNNKNKYVSIKNHAVAGLEGLEPGSTFKLASILVALEQQNLNLNELVDLETGKCIFDGNIMKDSNPNHGKRLVAVRDAFYMSSNVGISKTIFKYFNTPVEQQNFIDGLKKLHFGSPTGIFIPGEMQPKIRTVNSKTWNKKVDLAWVSIGYGIEISPIQILTFYNAIANNGKMMRPMLAKSIQESGKVLQVFEPQIIDKQIARKDNIKKAQQLLRGVAIKGTAKKIQAELPYFNIAGKTGTSKILDLKTKKYIEEYQASFVGYFPYENPKYTCIVVVNRPSNGEYYGSHVAAPVFKEIAEKIFASKINISNKKYAQKKSLTEIKNAPKNHVKKILNDLGISFQSDEKSDWVKAEVQNSNYNLKSIKTDSRKLANVKNMGMQDALYLLENQGVSVQVKGKGKVKRQIPIANTPIENIKKPVVLFLE